MDFYTLTFHKITSVKERMVYIPDSLFNDKLNNISFGQHILSCTFKSIPQNKCLITDDLWQMLGLHHSQKWRTFIHEKTLYIVPLIGVFTTNYNGSEVLPFGTRTEEFKRLALAISAQGGCACFFTSEHIDWDQGQINGLVYHDNQWVKKSFPFPHVVYDRTPNRRTEKLSKIKDIKQKFYMDYGIPWFNPSFFDKWDIHMLLQNHPLSNQYLPQTFPLTLKGLKRTLKNFSTVYIKPKNSSHGHGIKRVTKTSTNSYICQTNCLNSTERMHYNSLQDLLEQEFKKQMMAHYIIQQGIDLKTIEGRPYDFRIHTNKDGKGQWQMSAIAIKLAGEYRVTTHHFHGGKIKALSEVFDHETTIKLIKQLKEHVLTLSEALTEQSTDLIGELGIDLGIDQDGRIWLFEMNARPGKVIFHHPSVRKQEGFVHHLWYSYCLYLTKLSIVKPLSFISE